MVSPQILSDLYCQAGRMLPAEMLYIVLNFSLFNPALVAFYLTYQITYQTRPPQGKLAQPLRSNRLKKSME